MFAPPRSALACCDWSVDAGASGESFWQASRLSAARPVATEIVSARATLLRLENIDVERMRVSSQ
jgi:hypothetical protein